MIRSAIALLMVLAVLSIFGGMLNLPGLHTLTAWLEHTIEIHPGEFNMQVALTSTVIALFAIFLSWWLYMRKPLEAGQPDPLKKMLGPVFTGMENKWFVDEAYWFLFVDRYVDLARFLALVMESAVR